MALHTLGNFIKTSRTDLETMNNNWLCNLFSDRTKVIGMMQSHEARFSRESIRPPPVAQPASNIAPDSSSVHPQTPAATTQQVTHRDYATACTATVFSPATADRIQQRANLEHHLLLDFDAAPPPPRQTVANSVTTTTSTNSRRSTRMNLDIGNNDEAISDDKGKGILNHVMGPSQSNTVDLRHT